MGLAYATPITLALPGRMQEHCFGLTAEALVDKAMELEAVRSESRAWLWMWEGTCMGCGIKTWDQDGGTLEVGLGGSDGCRLANTMRCRLEAPSAAFVSLQSSSS